jgi:hypothetical protein
MTPRRLGAGNGDGDMKQAGVLLKFVACAVLFTTSTSAQASEKRYLSRSGGSSRDVVIAVDKKEGDEAKARPALSGLEEKHTRKKVYLSRGGGSSASVHPIRIKRDGR